MRSLIAQTLMGTEFSTKMLYTGKQSVGEVVKGFLVFAMVPFLTV